MIAVANDLRVTITGLGTHVPERVVTNDDLAEFVDTTDEWVRERTGIRERRVAGDDEAMSDLSLPAARQAMEQAGVSGEELDLIVVATVTPDMLFPATAAILSEELGASRAATYDLSAACTGFMYALAQAYAVLASGMGQKALVVGGDTLTKWLDWTDRSTCVLFGDGAGAVVLERVEAPGFLGFDLGADGSGANDLTIPGGGSRMPASHESVDAREHAVHMNGREVFKFATRILVSSAENLLEAVGLTVDDVDLYVPHQANIRIIDYAVEKLGISKEKVVTNVDRYGNTSSGSIPLALADAVAEGRVKRGDVVLMTGMGGGLTWGSSIMEWTLG